ncbi:A-kinase anchor protein 9 [Acipenser ruthenus]|uniref:A-kinase anchor protein 9 n=1 Tax=Acipenser ruthenus TaxID=7906 RepID=A0A444UAS8_ACIRT|nr:A-kinase anchor protein 9 [Acipenser ruthenus]
MEDDERQKKLEAGKAKLAEYRQRKAQADGQKKQKKKKKSPGTREGVNAQDGPDHDQSVGEDPTEQSTGRGASANSAEFTISRTLRSGDTIKQDQTYTIEEEDVHVSETHSEHQAQSSQTRLEMMEDELAGKQRAIEELNRELEVMRSAIGTEGLQQLQDFEAAVKQRDGIITQLTANLQQARKEKDEIMREFLELTEQSQKLQIQFQQLQAGETLRNTSHSSTAADFLQAKQQILKYQQQIEEQELQLKSYQSKSEEYQLQINLLQERAKEFKTANETLRNTSHSSNAADLLQAKQQILKYQQQIEEQELQLKSYQSKSEEYQLQINLLQDRAKEFETFANEQEGSVSQRLQEKEQLIKQQENTITEHMNTETELKEKLLASDMLLEDLSKERCQDIETLKTELNNSKQRERQSSSEIKQLMGTVEELQKHFHKGNLSESEIIQKMEVDTQQKMDQLRAELDEMYGEQIVQMKQELRKQHMTEMDKLIAQHRSELELRQVHRSGSVANEDQVNLMNMAINELNVKLQEAQFQKDQVKQELSRQLAKVTEEKSSLQTQVEDLLEDLRFAREKAQRASRSISEQEQKLGEVGNLQATISDLKDQLVAAAESTKELELKHESEVTNYKIKLEMLEREKDAVLDRMAESQEAELERLRTQLLFSHEEEIIKLKEDLQRGSQINIENLKDDLALKYKQKLEGLQKSFNEQLESVKIERDSLVTEKEALIADISKMKEDVNQSLESSKTEEMTLQIKELHTEIKALQKVEEENGALENKIQQLLAKNELLEKQIKKKEDDMDRKIKELEDENGRLNKSREVLKQKLQASNLDSGMSASENSAATCAVGMETQTSNEQLQIERLASENEQLKNEQVQLKEEIKRQRNTFSFAEKNFEVNYQELNDEYTCLLKVKAGLEERIIKERVQYEAKMNSLHTQILQSEKEKLAGSGVLAVETSKVGKTVRDCIDGGEIVEKDTTELMEKLEVAQREKKELSLRLSEVSDKLNLKQNEIEQLKKEMGSLKDEYRQHVGKHKELNVTQETRVKTLEYQSLEYSSGITATEIVDTGSCTLENHYHQIALLEEKVIALQTSLQNATLERNQFQEKEKSLIHEKESLLARLQELKGKAVTESPAVATVQPDRDQLQQQLDTFKTEQLGLAKLMQQKALVEESLHKKLEEKEKALIAAEKEMFNLHERLNKLYQRDCADERFVEKHEEKVECSGIEQDEKDIVDHMNRTQLITENWPEMENKQQLAEAEFRLQMEAQRISLTQIYAAQRELVQEKLQTDKKQCLSLLKEDLTTRHRQEVDRLHKKYQQELKDLKEQKTDESDERMSSQQQIQKLIKLVSEECKQLILSFGSVFGEKELEALHYKEPAEAKRSSDESSAGTKEQTGDPSSLLHEAKELHTELQKLKDKILQEYNSLTGLQTLLKSDSHKLEELQKAYDEFRCSSQEEMTSLRMQIESARASTEDLHDLKEQLKVRSARLEEIEKLKSEFNLQRNQFEDQHTQEIERLRMYYQQQIKETEERYTTEMIILQQRLQDVTGSEAQFRYLEDGLEAELQYPLKSMRLTEQLQTLRRALYATYLQEVTALKEQHKAELDMLASRLREQHSLETEALSQGITESANQEDMNGGCRSIKEPESSEVTGKDAMQTIDTLEKWYKKKIEEEIAKVIVQISVEFAQQTELARITKQARETTSEMQTVSEDPEREAESKTEAAGLVFESNRQELERKIFEKQLKEKTEEIFLLRNQIHQTSCTLDKECQFPEINIELSIELATEKEIVLQESMVYKEGTSAEALSSAGHLDKEHQEDIYHELFHLDEEQIVEPLRHSHKEQQERQSEEQHILRAQLAQNEGDNKEVPQEASPHPEASAQHAEKPASDDLTVERNILKKVNERLRIVLSEVLKTTAAAEETIGRHVEGLLVASSKGAHYPQRAAWEQAAEDPLKPHIVQGHGAGGDVSSESCQGSDAGGGDANVWSRETDEGLEMSQRLAEGMFTGAELDLENEEFMVNISTRLQAAVEKLLEAITETTNQSCQGSDAGGGDANVWSRETDEGLEMSQRLAEGMFTGAELDLENEEFMVNISTRLQAAVEKLLEAITETTNQLEHARITQTELTRKSFRRNAEINELVKRQEELQERLSEETKARELLALELHKAEGILDGYADERVALEEQVKQKAEIQQHLEQELQLTGSHLRELEEEQQIMHSSSDWSQRMYYDISTQNQEYRITPEEARRDNEMPQTSSEVLPDKIKYLLREVLQEGIQVLSLSEVPCIEGKMGTSEQYSECWQKEKQALLATVESLRVLITKMQVHRDTEISLNFASAEGVADWRGELLQAIQQVFLKERSVLKSALETHMASLETSDIFVHLNQLENRLREQDARNRDAMEILQDADRNSLLMEIGQLQAQLQRAQQDGHQDYTLQDNQASVVELEVNRVKESGNELKDRFHSEKMVIAELKNELAQTKLELETTLKAQHKHLKELEALRTEVSEKTAEMDMLNDALANEQKKSRELQWAFENEKCKSERKQEREKEEFEDLKFTLEDQKRKNCQISTLLEQERQAAANLKQQTETEKTLHQAQLSHELSRISELQVLLDSEKARALELNSALEQEKELRSQLNLSPQRRLEAGDSTADAGCSQMEDGVRTMKELLGDLQGQLDEKHTRIVQLLEDMERHKLEVVQVRQQLDEERQLHRKALQKEQEAYRLVQDKLEQLQLKDEDLQRLLDRERQLVVRLQQERERLQESVSELQDQENQRENADQPDPQTSLCRADIPVDRTRDWVLQQKISDVLTVGSSGHSLNEANGGIAAPADIKHLDGIIQRLQLIASKLKTLASKASSRIPFEAADDENLIWLQNSVQDIVSQLQQLPAIRPKVEQSVLLPTGSSSSSSLTERLLRQNAELTGFVSRLTEEKNDLRNSLIKLEEEVRRFRQRGLGGLHYSNRKPLDNQDTIDVLTSDQETWSREKDNLEKSLHQAETEVNKLRAELRSDALYRDMTGSDVDNVTLKRIYGKYLRAESFRKALIYQKKYLLLLLGGFQECEEATLSFIAKMGGRPSHNLEIITHRCRGFTRFRSAVRVTIAISRMKFLVRRWQRAAGSGSSPSSSINRNGFGQITGISQLSQVQVHSLVLTSRITILTEHLQIIYTDWMHCKGDLGAYSQAPLQEDKALWLYTQIDLKLNCLF